jgi:hypothetical protein
MKVDVNSTRACTVAWAVGGLIIPVKARPLRLLCPFDARETVGETARLHECSGVVRKTEFAVGLSWPFDPLG